jgi:hypothetical protein
MHRQQQTKQSRRQGKMQRLLSTCPFLSQGHKRLGYLRDSQGEWTRVAATTPLRLPGRRSRSQEKDGQLPTGAIRLAELLRPCSVLDDTGNRHPVQEMELRRQRQRQELLSPGPFWPFITFGIRLG